MQRLDIPEEEKKAKTLEGYMTAVIDRNRAVNLTAITDPEEFVEKHYIDSLSVASLEEFGGAKTVIDLGTGAGFPGVPLAVAFPEKEFLLADSLNKRIEVVQEFCRDLEIRNVRAIHGRAEDLGRREDLREHFDICISRAVADLSVLAEYCLPFVKVGGWFISYKGPSCEEEVREAEHAIGQLGGVVEKIVKPDQNAGSGHKLVLIRKKESTPPAYPRRPGKPAKSPLRASK
ncbi:MAG: 16S rRNA (guanine(527)-N(7))-methyltransferase RsmG [Firmicutes bacterium]|nr:16S rRNA (guanine(527)-N(7))-methyltransferase RsmG [Bacillota bacterium]